jgi:hypothetical protein
VRNIANLVPPYSPSELFTRGVSAELEFAVQNLKVKYIIRTAEACEHLWSIGIGLIRATSSTNGCR